MRVVPEIWNQAIVYLPPKQGAAFFVLKKRTLFGFIFLIVKMFVENQERTWLTSLPKHRYQVEGAMWKTTPISGVASIVMRCLIVWN